MRVALLEDDEDLARLVVGWLGDSLHEVEHFRAGEDLIVVLPHRRFDLFIFDWMLPGMTGVDVVKQLRRTGSRAPVLFLTQFDSVDNVATALNAGADDYLAKPVTRNLLLSRVQSLLGVHGADSARDIGCGRYRTDAAKVAVLIDERPIALSAAEYALAWLLIAHAGRLVSRSELRRAAWATDDEGGTTQGVDAGLHVLKAKILLDGSHGLTLTKVHNLGYRLEIAGGGERPGVA